MNLTPRTFVLAAFVALLGIVEQWSEPMPFPAWRLAGALLLAGGAYEWLRVRGSRLQITPETGRALALGREERLALRFENHDVRPWPVLFAAGLPPDLATPKEPRRIDVAPGDAVTAEIAVRPLTLGSHLWPSLPVRLRGPLGLAWWTRRYRLDALVRVVPDLLRAPARAEGSARGGGATRAVAGSGSELHRLREYRPGDPRHTIDWKATARTGTLITRVFSEDQHLEVVLVLDVGRTAGTRVGALTQLGHYANVAARFVEHAAAAEDRVALVAVSDQLVASTPPQRGLAGVLGIRRVLAGLESRPVESDLVRAALEVQRLVRHRALVVVLTDLYGQETGGRLAQSIRLLLPRHLPVVVSLVAEELEHLAHRPAVRWIDAYESLAAGEYRDGVWRNASALRRQGAQTVVTAPAELEARVLSLYRRLRAERRI